jgi:hypothetical protein
MGRKRSLDMKNIRVWFLIIVLLPACNGGITTPITGNPSPMGNPSAIALSDTSDPIHTSTMTLTPTITETPTITMTPTPPPDLELMNYTLEGSSISGASPDAGWYLMGEIRNNSDSPMILFANDKIFQFYLDRWQGNEHTILGPIGIAPSTEKSKTMSCILYPGETGVISRNLYGFCPSDTCNITTPAPSDPVKGEIVTLRSYTSHYKRWEDIKDNFPPEWSPLFTGFHPSVENVQYEVTGNGYTLHASFDVNVKFPQYTRSNFEVISWIVLYDDQNHIFNILYGPLALPIQNLQSGKYHVDGIGKDQWCVTTSAANQCWYTEVMMTPERLQRLDHIRVFAEMEDLNICEEGYG